MSQHIPSYIQASLPDLVTILYLDLKPFTLGHYLLMLRHRCAFVDTTNNLGCNIEELTKQLILGLSICHRTHDEFNEWIYSEGWKQWLEEYGNIVREQSEKDKSFNILEKILMFRNYIEEGMKFPEATSPKGSGKTFTHWTSTVMDTMISKCGYTEKQILNEVPLRKVLYHFFKYLESNGVLKIAPEELCH